MIPATEFVRSGDADIAYKVIGEGPRDLVLAFPLVSNVDVFLELTENAEFVERLTHLGRVILFDKRGTGMSDRSTERVTVEQHSDDLIAVLDAAESTRAVLLGWFDGGATCLVTAARHPGRVESVVANEVLAAGRPVEGFPWGFTSRLGEAAMRKFITLGWGQTVASRLMAPEWASDPRLIEWVARYERLSVPPSGAVRVFEDALDLDIRAYLPHVDVPVLVIHNVGLPGAPSEPFEWLADELPRGRLRLARTPASVPFMIPSDDAVDDIEEFLVGTRSGGRRELASIVFTDVVGSTTTLAREGDLKWRNQLSSHRESLRRSLARYGGREVNTAGDGFVACFPLPSSGLRFAGEAVRDAAGIGLGLRAGMHCGEVLVDGADLIGIAVHVAARVASHAGAGEVFVTDTVRVLVDGSGLRFESVGSHRLKGVPGAWHLFRMAAQT
ncbi:class 3 adenylate cyclase [Agromyces flavus]|uniref:Class 3 adenylate cyclase n=1 Tax=Agromyces flavus TaxID=589382 RepID=A0ABT1KPE9_9MICO|nr:adenylate/guanylate cyclase domain-containing protein [Agromyces flavus]MCP2368703.1 class 3 adenylate cyclase [Agromyces flavus]GGI48058.1 lignin peroxidase LipJ [Agromyces flavus]